jgi:hypothetical protein
MNTQYYLVHCAIQDVRFLTATQLIYTFEEYCEMMLLYGESGKNSKTAASSFSLLNVKVIESNHQNGF